MTRIGQDLDERIAYLKNEHQKYENTAKGLMCLAKTVTAHSVSEGTVQKKEIVESIAQYAPLALENETITDYLSSLPREMDKKETKDLTFMLLDESKKYIQGIKKLENQMETEQKRPKGGLNRLIYSMFDGREEPDIRTDYQDNRTIHGWLENLWIDFHNHAIKNVKG